MLINAVDDFRCGTADCFKGAFQLVKFPSAAPPGDIPKGIDVPFGGISWEYTETEKQAIQKLFFFLESKRLLTNPIEMEIKQWCIESALEIKRRLVDTLSECDFSKDTIGCIRSMIGACNDFLDRLDTVKETGIIFKNEKGDWANSAFSSAMKQFRNVFRENINLLSSVYGIIFTKTIPTEY